MARAELLIKLITGAVVDDLEVVNKNAEQIIAYERYC
jgi:hypothetical protein